MNFRRYLFLLLIIFILLISISGVSADGSFIELQEDIDDSGDFLEITQDYTYNKNSDSSLSENGVLIKEIQSKTDQIDLFKTIKHASKCDGVYYFEDRKIEEEVKFKIMKPSKKKKENRREDTSTELYNTYNKEFDEELMSLTMEHINKYGIFVPFLYIHPCYLTDYEDDPEEFAPFEQYKNRDDYEDLINFEFECCGESYNLINIKDRRYDFETCVFGLIIESIDNELKVNFACENLVNYNFVFDIITEPSLIECDIIKLISDNIIYKE